MTRNELALPLGLLLLGGLASPAAAQYRRTGLLSWSFDDITVNAGAGRVHSSQWAQLYALDLDGPLFSPVLGAMKHSFSFSKGASLSQAANTGIPSQQQIAYSASLDLFSPQVRRYVRLAPNFSRTYLHQEGSAGGLNYSNTVANTSWGLSTGLSLPKLPSFNYSRQVNEMRNPSDVNPVRQRSTTDNKSVSYYLGHFVLNASEQNNRVDDRLGLNPPQTEDYKQASLEANFYDPKWARSLQSLFFRSDLSQNENNGQISQQNGSAAGSLMTQKFRQGKWESTLSYGVNASRDYLRRSDVLSHNAGVNSSRPVRNGTLSNSLTASHSPTSPSESVGDAVSVSRTHWRGNLNSNLGASGGWSHAPMTTLLNDGLNARFDLFPLRPFNYYAEARTSGQKAVLGVGGSRVNRYGLGASDRTPRMTLTARLDRTDSSYYVSQTKSVSHQLALESSGRPTPKLVTTAGYSLGVVSYPGKPDAVSHNVHGSLDYSPWRGLDLSASATYAGTGSIASASISYSLGKTSFKVSYEYRDMSTAASYQHFSINLSRML